MTLKSSPLFLSIVLFLGTAVTIGVGTWMFAAKPLRPKINTVEKTVYVDRPIPCPAIKTGTASAKGTGAIAHSGNGDTYTINPQNPSSKHP